MSSDDGARTFAVIYLVFATEKVMTVLIILSLSSSRTFSFDTTQGHSILSNIPLVVFLLVLLFHLFVFIFFTFVYLKKPKYQEICCQHED